MYKTKPCGECEMPPAESPLKVLVLNASLKRSPEISNTGEVVQLVLDFMKPYGIQAEMIRLADHMIPTGLGFREGPDDDWPEIVSKIKASGALIFATPIWWGGRSSLMQRVIERLDALDEEYSASGRSAIYNKVAGIVITGSEDGALSVMGGRSGPAAVRGSGKAAQKRRDGAHGDEPGAQSRVLRTAAQGSSAHAG